LNLSAHSTRRAALARAGGAAMGLAGLSSFLDACANSTSTGPTQAAGSQPVGPGGILLPRPARPGTMPIYKSNPTIASGLPPEQGATLQVYNWDA